MFIRHTLCSKPANWNWDLSNHEDSLAVAELLTRKERQQALEENHLYIQKVVQGPAWMNMVVACEREVKYGRDKELGYYPNHKFRIV